jgi:hypothetical protein
MKILKKLLLAAVGCILAGLLLAFVALAAVGFKFSKFSTVEHREPRQFSLPAADVTALTLDVQNSRIEVEYWTNDTIEITYYTNSETEFAQSSDGGHMELRQLGVIRLHWWQGLTLNFVDMQEPTIKVKIPGGSVLTADFCTSNSSVNISGLNFLRLDVKSSNAAIGLTKTTVAGDLTAKSSNGSITLQNVSCKGGNVQTSNGALRLESVEASEELKLHTSNAQLKLQQITAPVLTAETSNGEITFAGVACSQASLYTSNSAINGSVPSFADYTITAQTTNAGIHVGQQQASGGGKLTVGNGSNVLQLKTSNGAIRVTG